MVKGQRYINDRLKNVDVKRLGEGVMRVIDTLQNFPPDLQIATCGAVFRLACERFDVQPREVLDVLNNTFHDGGERRPEVKAATLYMLEEW